MKLTEIEKSKLRTWVELDRKAIKANYRTFKSLINKDTILMAVVKSNAYGHGLVPFSKEVVKTGINFLGVDSFQEALDLRKVGIKARIMVFGYVSPFFFRQAVSKNISITISGIENLKAMLKISLNKKIKIHLKVDTGLGRQGFLMNDMSKVLKLLKSKKGVKNIELEGIYSHLAKGEDLAGREYTMLQAKRLNKWYEKLIEIGYKPIRHLCATSSTAFFPELHYDMVRVGIGMYGLWSSKEMKLAFEKKIKLHPVLSWKTIITEIKKIKKGSKIGYDLTETLKRDSVLGVVPVGYWHGYPRLLSNKGVFNVNGKKTKLIGRVSMDMITLDLTDVKAKVLDEVAILGGDYGHYAEADIMAQDSDTINYEITTRINPVIKRFYRINPQIKRFIK